MEESWNAYTILVQEAHGKRPFGRPWCGRAIIKNGY
jgi:hypothetical protein